MPKIKGGRNEWLSVIRQQAFVDQYNDPYEHDPQYQKQHLIDIQIVLALLQLYDGPIHQFSNTNIYNEEFLIALVKFKAVYNDGGYHRLKLDQEEPYHYELNGFIDPDMVRYAREQGDQNYEQLFQICFISMAGFVAGMLEASVRIAEGIAYAFWHPIETLQGISYAIWHWDQVAKHLWTEITTAYIVYCIIEMPNIVA